MTHALQVNFRKLLPNERLVALASERYQRIRNERPDTVECWVTLETLNDARGQPVQAAVTLHGEDGPMCEAMAVHSKAHVALNLAMAQLQTRLGVQPEVTGMYWTQPVYDAPDAGSRRSFG
jgi:hypothetical protein